MLSSSHLLYWLIRILVCVVQLDRIAVATGRSSAPVHLVSIFGGVRVGLVTSGILAVLFVAFLALCFCPESVSFS